MSPEASRRVPRPVWADLTTRASLSEARARVLKAVEDAPEPVTATDVADNLGLHHNTVREHLDALAEAGFVLATPKSTGKRGRPAMLYSSTAPDPRQVLSSYLRLLDAVAVTLGEGPQAEEKAREIGRLWARESGINQENAEAADAVDQANPLAGLIPELAYLGFAPVQAADSITLHACPMVTSQRGPHPLVCLMHEGYINELLSTRHAASGAPQRGDQPLLQVQVKPFTAAGCQVSLAGTDAVTS